MNRSDFVPNLREFFLLWKLYHAKKRGYALECDKKPTMFLRLVDAGLVDLTSPSFLYKKWILRLNTDGTSCFMRSAWKTTVAVLTILSTIAAAIISVA